MKNPMSRVPARPRRLRDAVRLALLAGAGGALLAPVAHADPSGDSTTSLEEVVVTATRREQTILDVPYSISAISGASLDESHVQSLSDLSHMIAGLSFVDEGPTSRSNFVLRGINANATDQSPILGSAGTVPPVSTYIGETPLFLSLHLDDLDRVEVLRGPQGTLYGSGSLAGTIRFIPKQPDPAGFAANVDVDAADVAQSRQFNSSYGGMLNLPLTDISALRITAGREHYAGFIDENYIVKLGPASTAVNSPVGIPVSGNPKNPLFGPEVYTPVDDANSADIWQTRIAYLIKPSEDFSVLVAYYHQDDRSQGVQAVSPYFKGGSIDYPPSQNPFYSASYPVSFPTGGVVFPANGTYDANDAVLPTNHRKADLGSLDLSVGLGFATFSSSTSYYADRGTDVSDGSSFIEKTPAIYGFMPRVVDYEEDFDEQKGFVEELRLVSSSGPHPLDYVVGFFIQHLQGNNGQTQWLPGQTYFGDLAGVPGADPATGDVNYIVSNTTDFLDRALFGELTWHVTDQWQVTGGARFFKQDFETASYSALPYCGPYCGTGILGVTNVTGGYSANSHIWKLDTSYKVSEALNLYADYSEGFRRGGANAIPLSGPFEVSSALLVYKPDTSKNYELGAKGTFLGSINYTADVFFIDWNNFQLDTASYYGGYPLSANGTKAHSKGVELSFDGKVGTHLGYSLGYAYTKAQVAQDFSILDRLDDGTNNLAAIVSAKSGDPLPNSPENSVTLGLDYSHAAPMLEAWTMRWHLDANYRSSTYSRLLNTIPGAPPPFLISGFSIWNGSVDLANAHGLDLTLYGQNLFNALGITGGTDPGEEGPPPTNVRAAHYFISRPRTIGLRFGYKF